jgi:hypothetical protein
MCQELGFMWVSGDYYQRQKLQKLVFPQGLQYDKENDAYRTQKINSVCALITLLSDKTP